jgi:hypothetical protein
MRALSDAELLSLWERGRTYPPARQALVLLAAALPDTPPEALAALSIGERDACLLTLHEWTFGSELVSLVICPACSERLELTFDVADIRATPEVAQAESFELSLAGYTVRFRLPNSLDLLAVADQQGAGAPQILLQRCLLAAQYADEDRSAEQLPTDVLDAVGAHMAHADPQADVQLVLDCPSCGLHWPAIFDIVSFFWAEIETWAYRTLREIHLLASSYGWREADILAMSQWRRQCYLEIVSG